MGALELSAVYGYFNNDIGGKAIENAKTLKQEAAATTMVDGRLTTQR